MDMIAQGFVLMLVGMCVVFSFLVILVWCMMISANFFKKFAHFFPEEQNTGNLKKISSDHADVAVAIAAVQAFIK
ncbi:MAG: OadG family protein [Kiritimatiellae bacterium]|nr:OadG family protein [Kiritimatiellia bacterium]